MIVVDTSVWIDFFRAADTWQVHRLTRRLEADQPMALTDIVSPRYFKACAMSGP